MKIYNKRKRKNKSHKNKKESKGVPIGGLGGTPKAPSDGAWPPSAKCKGGTKSTPNL
jgi:hypothetical protein